MAINQPYSAKNYGNLRELSHSPSLSAANSPDTITLYEGELDNSDLSYIADTYGADDVDLFSDRYELEGISAEITWYDNHGLEPKGTIEMKVDRHYRIASIPEKWQKIAPQTNWTQKFFQKQKKDCIILEENAEWEKTINKLQNAQLDIL